MLDRDRFLRPTAHRGLHDAKRGVIENTAPAFGAAIAKGYGIECDLRPLGDGTPVVFHDATLERLIDGPGRIDAVTPGGLAALRYRGYPGLAILSYAGLLELVAGRVPLFAEIKSEWEPVNTAYIAAIVELSRRYAGPLALMSFDPAVMAVLRTLAPELPLGLVSGSYAEGWWPQLSAERRRRLANLEETEGVAPDFIAYQVQALPHPATERARAQGLPVLTWTVRSEADRETAARHADAAIFEGYEPDYDPPE